jgi:acetyl esterase/lipase
MIAPARLFGCFALGLAAPALAQPVIDHPAVAYATVGGRELLLDLYIPDQGVGPFPVVLWIHGGGWSGGSRANPGGLGLLNQGIAVASVDYRLSGQDALFGGESVHWPAQIHDCKAAVRFLRAHADEFNLDPHRVGAWGSSAGGHLAAMLAVAGGDPVLEGTVGGHTEFSSRVLAAADYFGPSDLLWMNEDVTTPPGSGLDHDAHTSPESKLIGYDQPGQGLEDLKNNLENPAAPYPGLLALVRSASPFRLVAQDAAPLFIAHGDADTSVPLGQSVKMRQAYSALALPHEFRQVAGAGHGFLGQQTNADTIEFFASRLRDGPVMYGADLTGDRRVDIDDLHAITTQPVDLNGDGMADADDARALEAWIRRDEWATLTAPRD